MSLFIVAFIVYGGSVFGPCLLLSVLSIFAIILMRNRAGFFALIVFLMSCGCQCSVALPRSAIDWYAVCDCGISW